MQEGSGPAAEIVITNLAEVATMGGGSRGPLLGDALGAIEIVKDAAIAIDLGEIVGVGPAEEIRQRFRAGREVDGGGRVATPGLVDPHTHLVYGGSREDEFERRVKGATYLEIAAAGGGIRASVRMTRGASVEELVEQSLPRVRRAMRHGTTTLEVKSGYGLDPDSEERMLEAIELIAEREPVDIVATFLGAHEIPDDRRDDRAGYIREVIEEQMPRARGRATFCDVFCEDGVFTPEESREILLAAREAGFRLKIHADEFASTGGAELAAELEATSADHLGAISEAGIEALAGSGTVAVLLPGTTFYAGIEKYPPARRMIEAGVAVALATDGNPGSCVTDSMQWILTLACLRLKMTPYEALAAATRNAACAIGLGDRAGVLSEGRPADVVVWDAPSIKAIPHVCGSNLVHQVYKNGTLVHEEG